MVANNDAFSTIKGDWSSFDKYPRQVADVNGDGRADIIGFGYDNVLVSLGESNGTFGQALVANNDAFSTSKGDWSSFDKYPRQVADVNGDGRADIIGFGYDDVLVSLGESNGTFGQAFVAKNDGFTVSQGNWSSFDKYPRQVADVNADGRADLVGFGPDSVQIALGQSNGTFGSTTVAKDDDFTVNKGGWTSFDGKPRQLGDVNGDGRADIVGFAEDGAYLALANNETTQPGNNENIVGGYLPGWTISENTDPNTIPTDKLTHLFYSFADVTPEGDVRLNQDYGLDGDISFLQSLKAENPNLKIIASIGGAAKDQDQNFSTAASTAESRANFVQSAVQFMRENGFDGLDIDWETPDKTENQNYIDLLNALDREMPADKLLTTALFGSSWVLEGGNGSPYKLGDVLKETSDVVDFINVMSYDYKGTWLQDTTTGHQAALYGNGKANADWAVNYYKQQGVDPKDIVLGVPLYGRYWTGVEPGKNNDGFSQTGTLPTNDKGEIENSIFYKDLYDQVQDGKYTEYWDDTAKVPYLYSETEQKFSTYENVQSVGAKAQYVKDSGIGGMFFWETSGDLSITEADSLINTAASELMV